MDLNKLITRRIKEYALGGDVDLLDKYGFLFNMIAKDYAEAINYTHSCTELKVVNTDKINKLNDALKNIEEDEDFRLDDGMEWIKQKSFIEGKINALTNL
jgi:hypothetical protein